MARIRLGQWYLINQIVQLALEVPHVQLSGN